MTTLRWQNDAIFLKESAYVFILMGSMHLIPPPKHKIINKQSKQKEGKDEDRARETLILLNCKFLFEPSRDPALPLALILRHRFLCVCVFYKHLSHSDYVFPNQKQRLKKIPYNLQMFYIVPDSFSTRWYTGDNNGQERNNDA